VCCAVAADPAVAEVCFAAAADSVVAEGREEEVAATECLRKGDGPKAWVVLIVLSGQDYWQIPTSKRAARGVGWGGGVRWRRGAAVMSGVILCLLLLMLPYQPFMLCPYCPLILP